MNNITSHPITAALKSKQGQSLGDVTADTSPEAFSLDGAVNLMLSCQPNSQTQYHIVYRIESPGFTPSRIPIGNFNEGLMQKYNFKAGEFERTKISAVFYHNNHEVGHLDFDFRKSDDGLYRKTP